MVNLSCKDHAFPGHGMVVACHYPGIAQERIFLKYDNPMRVLGILGSLGLFSGVALGAFAAHFLRSQLSQTSLATFETGVRYQIYHSLAILVAAVLTERNQIFATAGFFYCAGILLFSFSLYFLAWSGIKWIGIITPFGGLSFLVGHMVLLIGFLKLSK